MSNFLRILEIYSFELFTYGMINLILFGFIFSIVCNNFFLNLFLNIVSYFQKNSLQQQNQTYIEHRPRELNPEKPST